MEKGPLAKNEDCDLRHRVTCQRILHDRRAISKAIRREFYNKRGSGLISVKD